LPEKLEAYGIPRPTVDVVWQEGRHISWGISFRSTLGEAKFQAQREARADKRYRRPSAELFAGMSLQDVCERLQAELIERGLENVRVTIVRLESGYTIVVEYENRRYNRDELDGLGLVLGLAALHTPPLITQMSAIIKKSQHPGVAVFYQCGRISGVRQRADVSVRLCAAGTHDAAGALATGDSDSGSCNGYE